MASDDRLLPAFIVKMRGSVSQKELADRVKVTASYMSQVENGTTVPTDERLIGLAHALHVDDRLAEFLLRAAHDRVRPGTEWDQLRAAYSRMIQNLGSKAIEGGRAPERKTLDAFPQAFEPLVIVTGDVRRDPPKTSADIGVLSASPLEDCYLQEIALPAHTEKVTDKVFALGGRDYLRKVFGCRNLLVIGSPVRNHLARIVNRTAIFRFAVDRETADEIDGIVLEARRVARKLGVSGLEVLRRTRSRQLKHMLNEHRHAGVFDPLADPQKLRALRLRDGVDHAIVTIAKHPYAESDDYVAIMAAGFHLPGTVHAVRQLSKPTCFESHPLGGVLETRIPDGPWYERIEKAETDWASGSYTLDDLRKSLAGIAEHPNWPGTSQEADDVLSLVETISRVAGPSSRPTEHPGRSWTFNN